MPAYIAAATAGHSSNATESPVINTRLVGANSVGAAAIDVVVAATVSGLAAEAVGVTDEADVEAVAAVEMGASVVDGAIVVEES